MKNALTVATFLSVLIFPWPLTMSLVLLGALWIPLLPLAAGIMSDALTYAPSATIVPYGTLIGALLSAGSVAVRTRLSAGIIGE